MKKVNFNTDDIYEYKGMLYFDFDNFKEAVEMAEYTTKNFCKIIVEIIEENNKIMKGK
jgi:hypothetical protein